MAEIRWTSEAAIWIKDIFDYIAFENPQAAAKVVEGIYRQVQIFETFSDIGYRFRSIDQGEIWILLYGHYRIVYLRRNDRDVIDILGVFHDALDLDRYLQ